MKDADTELLLAWYINGTLSDSEQVAVEKLQQRSGDTRRQLDILRALQRSVQQEPLPVVSELGWRRLQRDIRHESVRAGRRDWWKPGLAVAATILLVLQAGILMEPDRRGTDTRLLSDPAVVPLHNAWLVQVVFDERQSWQDIQAPLREIGARIVSGPSSVGVLRIAVPQSGRFADARAMLDWLRQRPEIVHAALED